MTEAEYGFDSADTCAVIAAIDEQSTDIAMGVDKALEAKEHTRCLTKSSKPSAQETRV